MWSWGRSGAWLERYASSQVSKVSDDLNGGQNQCKYPMVHISLPLSDGDWKLVVVTQASSVGMLPHGGEVYCVDKIGIIPLTAFAGTAGEIIGMEVSVCTGWLRGCCKFP